MDLILVSPDEKNQIRRRYNVTSTQINQDVEIIKIWLSKQPHLQQNLSDDFVEKLLLRNKFRVKRTKQKLDNYFTLRGKYRDFLENWQNIRPSQEICIFLPMPKLSPSLERIYIYKIETPDPEFFSIYKTCKLGLALEELMLLHDSADGIRYLCDLSNYKLGHLPKTNPIAIAKFVLLIQGAYSARIRGFELVNLPPFIAKFMAIVKLALPQKLYERITLHENIESVYKVIPKENLPVEYGGTSGTTTDLLKKWDELFIKNEKFFLEKSEDVSREELRPPELNDDDKFGRLAFILKLSEMDVIIVSLHEKNQVRQHYNITSKQINEDVEIIKTWLLKQPHLPQNLSDDFIEKLLLRNKFRVERTKQKLDNYFTLRGKYRDFIENWQLFRPSQTTTTFLPMPKLTSNLERIYIYQVRNPDPEFFHMHEICKLCLAVEELMLSHDYAVGIRFLCDMGNYQLAHVPKLNPITITKFVLLLQGAYSARIGGFEYVNLPPFIAKIMAIIKLVLPQKLYERTTLHENMESVYKIIPKEVLPVEYGGTSGTMTDLLNKWDHLFIQKEKFFLENYENVSREELRPPELNDDDEAFGVQGTFKKLALD